MRGKLRAVRVGVAWLLFVLFLLEMRWDGILRRHILRSAAQWSRASESLLSKSKGPSRGRSVKTWLA
jgi:hypothetical protein